ncbi:MAG: hypothetical protein ABH824_02715 [Nanoarchaeota archaeon]|nr:hypothetical protein [Nanoarchaeota archaeon]MBU1632110.1 hypothetical protein [Nanoarchaeota archaeon]MBU1875744.1 hypothetical protein [Nanoarchaeota archaeon]
MIISYFRQDREGLTYVVEDHYQDVKLGKINDGNITAKFPGVKAVLQYEVFDPSSPDFDQDVREYFSTKEICDKFGNQKDKLSDIVTAETIAVITAVITYEQGRETFTPLYANEYFPEMLQILKEDPTIESILVEPTFYYEVQEYQRMGFDQTSFFVLDEEEKSMFPILHWFKQ